jgi:hypothetical protein
MAGHLILSTGGTQQRRTMSMPGSPRYVSGACTGQIPQHCCVENFGIQGIEDKTLRDTRPKQFGFQDGRLCPCRQHKESIYLR